RPPYAPLLPYTTLFRSNDVGRLNRTEQTTLGARLHSELDASLLKLLLESLCLFVGCDRAGLAGCTDLVHLLLTAARPRDSKALGNEVVTGVTVLDLDDVSGATQAVDLMRENQLRHVGAPYRPAPA